MSSTNLHLEPEFAGIPDVAHGGYVAGLLTRALGADASRVRLRRPVPLDSPLRIDRLGDGTVVLHGADGVLADAAPAEVLLHVPERVSWAAAVAAAERFPSHEHPFPACLVCGQEHPRGLQLRPGPVEGRDLVAALWEPSQEHAVDGRVRPELVSAALDCPQLWALMLHAPPTATERVVTSMLETRLEGEVLAGEPHVVIGWPIGRDGARWLAGAAVFGPDGGLRASGMQTAAVVDGWGVPLGRDHWAAAVARR